VPLVDLSVEKGRYIHMAIYFTAVTYLLLGYSSV